MMGGFRPPLPGGWGRVLGGGREVPKKDRRGWRDMADGLREWIRKLESAGELVRARREADPRVIPALLARARGAALLEKVTGHEIGVVGGLAAARRRLAIGM